MTEEQREAHNGIRIVVVVQAVVSDGVAIDVADGFDVGGPSVDGVKVMQRASDEGIRWSKIVVLHRNPSPHSLFEFVIILTTNSNWSPKNEDCLQI